MANNRIGKINEEILKELSNLTREVKDPRVSGAMFTITRVETTNDLSYAKVFVSVMGEEKKGVMSGLESASGFLRSELARRMSLRHTPRLLFNLDMSIDKGAHIINLINKTVSDRKDEE